MASWLAQRARARAARGGDEDRVEGRALRPAAAAVGAVDLDVGVAEPRQPLARELAARRGWRSIAIDVGGEPARDRARVARAGADLEHPVVGRDPRRLEHQGDDVGLRDRLPVLDRQRRVVVGAMAQPPRRRTPRAAPARIASSTRRVADAARRRSASRPSARAARRDRRRPSRRGSSMRAPARLAPGRPSRLGASAATAARRAWRRRGRAGRGSVLLSIASCRCLRAWAIVAELPVGDAEPEVELVVVVGARDLAREQLARGAPVARAAARAMPRSKKWNGGTGSIAASRVRAASASAGRALPGVGLGEVGQRAGVLRRRWRGRSSNTRSAAAGRRGAGRRRRACCTRHEARILAHALGRPGVGVVEPAARQRLGGAVVGVHREHRRSRRCRACAGRADLVGRQEVDRPAGWVARRAGVEQAPAEGDVDVAAREQQVAVAAPRLLDVGALVAHRELQLLAPAPPS